MTDDGHAPLPPRGAPASGRMVYSSWFGDLGGGELRMLDHLRATAFPRERIHVLVGQPGRLLDELARLRIGASLIVWKGGSNYVSRQFHWYRARLRTAAALRRLAPSVVVCNTFHDFDTMGRVALGQSLRVIWRARADTFTIADQWPAAERQALVARLNTQVQRVLATTNYEKDLMLHAGVDPAKVFVVANGVDLSRYGKPGAGAKLRAECGIASGQFTVAFVARMVPQKGYEVFFDAIARVKAQGIDVRALVAGDTTLLEESPDAYKASLRRQVERLGIAGNVHFLGFRDDVDAVMQAADVFVLASLKEPFGTTVIEAMAASRPVVSSDLPGPRESIVDGRTGLFFPLGDAARLAEQLCGLQRDPARARALGEAGRRRVEADFDLVRNAARLDQHCVEVARGMPPAPAAAVAAA